tara:strand:+ start:765 stop:1043 length:279 start_codon:yes stop_codon:yes gene_type:complete
MTDLKLIKNENTKTKRKTKAQLVTEKKDLILNRLSKLNTWILDDMDRDAEDIIGSVRSGDYGYAGWLCSKCDFLQDVISLRNDASNLMSEKK